MILEIVTPEAVLYKGNVSIITLPGAKGSFQILENHAPIVALLEKGTITFTESEAPKSISPRSPKPKENIHYPSQEGSLSKKIIK